MASPVRTSRGIAREKERNPHAELDDDSLPLGGATQILHEPLCLKVLTVWI